MPSPPEDLDALARSLVANGPVKTLGAAPKRVRIRLRGSFVADSTHALYVWEHVHYPRYYMPATSFAKGTLSHPDPDDGYALGTLGSTEPVIVFGVGMLAGLVRVASSAATEWFEEDVRVLGHPKDPFKRVDVFFSTRPVRVSLDGTELASAPACFQLYETGLPARFYLPATSVRDGVLEKSDTVSTCPYKGQANYFDVVMPETGERLKNLVWYYVNPTLECAAIAGSVCFYNEKVDIELDGVKLERPKTGFS